MGVKLVLEKLGY